MCFGKSGHVESEKLAARPAKQQPRYNYGTAPNSGANYNRRRVNNNAEAAANGLQAGAELYSYGGHHQHHGHSGTHHHQLDGGHSAGNDGAGGNATGGGDSSGGGC
ncbi:hypothetical protein FJTKL_12747 [Diaporthe vaccinii]|uniref:Uncharacterized protein n=1 Tax=Diaporthe vaccinii TaxID=105482 RepID=A0ABR4ECL0_9PEZI